MSLVFYFLFLFFNFWPNLAACRILVPRPGTEPVPPAMEVRSPNHWTTREFAESGILEKGLGW